jgi:hypothetical protein
VNDVLFVLITVAFFALCVGYVRVCDRIIGPDAPEASTAEGPSDEAEVAVR